MWAVALLFAITLGPSQAHSIPEFLAGWTRDAIAVAVAVGIAAAFLGENLLAYPAAIFCLSMADSVVGLLSQPAASYRWNGVLLLALSLLVVGWLLLPGRSRNALPDQS